MELIKPQQTELEAGFRGLHVEDVREDTKIATAALYRPPSDVPDLPTAQPIYATAAWKLNTVEHFQDGLKGKTHIYTRFGNPTVQAAEAAINLLEGGSGSVCFSSGNAGIYAAMTTFLKAGDHVVATYPMYVGAYQIIKSLARAGIESTFTAYSVEDFKKAVKPNTRLFYAQSPSEYDVIDLEGLAQLASSIGNIITVVDSSCASPYCLKPLKYGIDIAFHTATKYLSGHCDLIAGVLTARTLQQYNQILATRSLQGNILSPFDSFLLLRGIHTLHIRMQRTCDNAEKVVAFLDGHPKVKRLYYPSLPSFNGHEFAKKQMNRYGGRLCFDLKGGKAAGVAFVENTKLMHSTPTFGGPTSYCDHSATMSHGPARMTDEDRSRAKIDDGLIRICVGLEDPEDIINEIKYLLDTFC